MTRLSCAPALPAADNVTRSEIAPSAEKSLALNISLPSKGRTTTPEERAGARLLARAAGGKVRRGPELTETVFRGEKVSREGQERQRRRDGGREKAVGAVGLYDERLQVHEPERSEER